MQGTNLSGEGCGKYFIVRVVIEKLELPIAIRLPPKSRPNGNPEVLSVAF